MEFILNFVLPSIDAGLRKRRLQERVTTMEHYQKVWCNKLALAATLAMEYSDSTNLDHNLQAEEAGFTFQRKRQRLVCSEKTEELPQTFYKFCTLFRVAGQVEGGVQRMEQWDVLCVYGGRPCRQPEQEAAAVVAAATEQENSTLNEPKVSAFEEFLRENRDRFQEVVCRVSL